MIFTLLLSLALAQEDDLDARRDVVTADREERRILSELDGLDRDLYGVEQEISELQERADELEQQRMVHEDELSRAQAELDARGERVGVLLKALYHINRRGFARILFSAEDPSDLRRRSRYLLSILNHTDDVVEGYSEQVEIKQSAVDRVDIDRDAVGALQAELRLKEARLRDDRARRLALLDEVRTDRDKALRLLGERNQVALDMDSRVQASSASTSGPQVAFRGSYGKLRWPVAGRILRGYGGYTDPTSGGEAFNQGVDIAAAKHTPVRAVGPGTVTHNGWITGYGITVIVDHGGGYKTVYSHLGNAKVKVGQNLKKDQVVGTVGETGVLDDLGPRLHFEVRKNERPQDPVGWLGAR